MASFTVDFLGCKVSHTDAQALRERLPADGHLEAERPAVAAPTPCAAPSEAAAKSRTQPARLALPHRRVYATGCGATPGASGFARLPENVVGVAKPSEDTADAVAADL